MLYVAELLGKSVVVSDVGRHITTLDWENLLKQTDRWAIVGRIRANGGRMKNTV